MKLRLVALVAMLALFGGMVARGPLSVAAQDASSEPSTFDFKDLEGIQAGVSRSYSVDFESLLGTPGADSMPTAGLFSVSGIILKFENDDNAKSAIDTLTEQVSKQESGEEAVDLKEEDVDGVGDDTKAYSFVIEESGTKASSFLIITRDDEYVYFTSAISFSEDDSAKTAAVDLAKHLKDADAGDGDGEVKEDGTSTGGLWDMFPAADDELLQGLLPTFDQQVYPEAQN